MNFQFLPSVNSTIDSFFFVLIGTLALFSIGYILVQVPKQLERTNTLFNTLKKETPETIAKNHQGITSYFSNRNAVLASAWQAFNANLIPVKRKSATDSEDVYQPQKTLRNPLIAEDFFNPRTLQISIGHSRLLAVMPAILTGFGVLGTFVGLLYGLAGLSKLHYISTASIDDIKNIQMLAYQLTDGIFGMIGGAATAFKTSVWGVFASLVVNLSEKVAAAFIQRSLRKSQNLIDALYPHIDLSDFLQSIDQNTGTTGDALANLDERLGDRLQEGVQQLGVSLSETFTKKLEELLVPALDKVVDATEEQIRIAGESAQKQVEILLVKFQKSLEKSGQKQGNAIDEATRAMVSATDKMAETIQGISQKLSNSMNELVDNYSDSIKSLEKTLEKQGEANAKELSSLFANMSEQLETQKQNNNKFTQSLSEQLDHVLKETDSTVTALKNNIKSIEGLTGSFDKINQSNEKTADKMNVSAGKISEASNILGQLSSNIDASIQKMNDSMDSLSKNIKAVSDANELNLQIIQTATNGLTSTMENLEKTNKAFIACTDKADHSFANLTNQFDNMMDSIKHNTEDFSSTLAKQMEGYHQALTTNMDNRMNQWNKATADYTSQMTQAITAMGAVVNSVAGKTQQR